MCGIAGIHLPPDARLNSREARRLVEQMTATLVHRGPDDEGLWEDSAGRCVLGHRRLSVIDTSSAGRQPMTGVSGTRVMTYNGEIYNFQELRRELETLGVRIRGRTDTEVLIEALACWGLDALPRLDGMFAFAAFDGGSGELLLARDPFGEKPLYYRVLADGALAFASELQALEGLPGFDGEVSLDALAELIMFQYVGAPRTIYRGVHKLPPGHWLRVNADGTQRTGRYFEFAPGGRGEFDSRPLAELADEAEDILVRSVRRRMIADVPLGAFLSGGVDSSTVCALIRRKLGLPLQTFTVGFEGDPDSEHAAARRFAHHLGTEHHEQVLQPSTSDFLLGIGAVLDEPNADSSCMPTYLLSRFARERVKVAVSGDGGDELFGGYDRYLMLLAQAAQARPAWRAGDAYYGGLLLVGLENDVRQLLGELPDGAARHLAALRAEVNSGREPLQCRLRRTDVANYLPGAVLAKVDRMSMRHSLEVRTPYLSTELARFCERLPQDALFQPGRGKRLLREIAKRYLPADLIDAPKRGFGIPVSRWARAALLRVGHDLLSDPESRLRAALGPGALDHFLAVQRSRRGFSPYKLWSVAMLESWLRHHPARMPLLREMRSDFRRRTLGRAFENLRAYHRSHGTIRTALRVGQKVAETAAQPIASRRRARDERAMLAGLQRRIDTLNAAGADATLAPGDHLVLFSHSLGPGGAQRQWCYLALGLKDLGYAVDVVLTRDPVGEFGHYLGILRRNGIDPVPLRASGDAASAELSSGAPDGAFVRALAALSFGDDALRLTQMLQRLRPRAIFSALDEPNLVAGIAGTLAGVPRIVLSFRNYNPSRFSYLDSRPYLPVYRALCTSRRVRLTGNSPHGNSDYAAWLGIDPHRIALVPNAISEALFPEPSAAELESTRRALRLEPGAKVVLGVFRLSEEKQPELFLEVCVRLARSEPDVTFLHCGTGLLEPSMRRWVSDRGLQGRLQLLGNRPDIPAIMRLSSLLLLTSAAEGVPNVLLEAQFSGLPVVTTRAGATDACVRDGETGYVVTADATTLAESCVRLLRDPELAARMRCAAARYAKQAFPPGAMARAFLRATEFGKPSAPDPEDAFEVGRSRISG